MATEISLRKPDDTALVDQQISGLDALDLSGGVKRPLWQRVWSGVWPKVAAIGIALLIWQIVVWSGWKPEYALPGPIPVLETFFRDLVSGEFWQSVATTLRRGVIGFVAATVIGLVLGIAVARFKVLRTALGSLITGLQTMPSIAWFPLAILLFQLTEGAIFFVVVLGAAPSVANGVLAGVDYVPTVLLRAGRNLGARGLNLYRYVIGPASLPSIVSGLKQGWAFAWRSLMAGELLVIIAERPSLGVRLTATRELSDARGMMATMIAILVIGVLADLAFSAANNAIRRRWGLST